MVERASGTAREYDLCRFEGEPRRCATRLYTSEKVIMAAVSQ